MVPRQNDLVKDYTIDPNDLNLSYIPWKGTTFNRKTTVEQQIEYLPREFVEIDTSKFTQGTNPPSLKDSLSNISLLNDTESHRSALNVKYKNRQLKMVPSFNKNDQSI